VQPQVVRDKQYPHTESELGALHEQKLYRGVTDVSRIAEQVFEHDTLILTVDERLVAVAHVVLVVRAKHHQHEAEGHKGGNESDDDL
jgi:hypothetical protein